MLDPTSTTSGGRPPTQDVVASTCGIVMPLAALEERTACHWEEVLTMILEVIAKAGLEPQLISSATQSSSLQPHVVRGLTSFPVVLCDVSGRAPNVMFELGMRLALDRPVLLLKDDATDYSFVDCPVECHQYPRDLTHPMLPRFKEELAAKLSAIYRGAPWRHPYPLPSAVASEPLPEIIGAAALPQGFKPPAEELMETRDGGRRKEEVKLAVTTAAPGERPIIELQGWKTCDVHGFISGVDLPLAKGIVVTKSDNGNSHFLLLPVGLAPTPLIRDLGFFAGTDSVRLLQ